MRKIFFPCRKEAGGKRRGNRKKLVESLFFLEC
jgi:hypothetical protein